MKRRRHMQAQGTPEYLKQIRDCIVTAMLFSKSHRIHGFNPDMLDIHIERFVLQERLTAVFAYTAWILEGMTVRTEYSICELGTLVKLLAEMHIEQVSFEDAAL